MKSYYFNTLKNTFTNILTSLLFCFFIFNSSTIFSKTIKDNANIYPNLELFINTDTAQRSTRIFYIEGKTTNFDNGYDSSLFGGTSLSFEIYTQLVSDKKGKKLAIQTLPNEFTKMVIPIGLIANANQEITFSVITENLPQNLDIYLEDRVNKLFINLSQQQYTYTITQNTNGVGQFFLHTSFTGTRTPPFTAIWTGNTNNDWHTFSNWISNTVPSSASNIIVSSDLTNYPTANSAVTFKLLTIESGASFIPKNNATGIVTYKRNITDTKWHLISTSLSGENSQNIIKNHPLATGLGDNIGIGTFTNNGNTPWIYATQSTNNPILSGSGMSIKLATAGKLSFTGTINTTTVNYPITTGSRNNFNLIGNPFTAYVNSANFAFENTEALNTQTIWIWNGTSYITYNANNSIEIAPTQAFFVEANSNKNVVFNTSNQRHKTTDTFKRQAVKPSFELFVENESSKKSTQIFYVANKTTGFDNGYDSKLFGGIKSSNFEIFTQLITDNKGDKLAIQTLPTSKIESMVIPVGLTAKSDKEIIFSVDIKNLPADVKIYLEDRIANTFTNISDKKHKIVLKKEAKGTGQFYIHTTSKNLEITSIQESLQEDLKSVSIFKSANNSITITGLQNENVSVNIYSMLGEKVFETSFKATDFNLIQLPKIVKGVYIVELISNFKKRTKKIILE